MENIPVQSVGKMGVTTLGTIFTDMEKVTEHIAGVVDTQSLLTSGYLKTEVNGFGRKKWQQERN